MVTRMCAAGVLLAASLLTGCGVGSECENGPDLWRELGPSLVLDSAIAGDGEPLDTVELSRLRFDGRPVDPRALVSAVESEGLVLVGGRLTCRLPCALAGTRGTWQLRVTDPAAGTVRVVAQGRPRVSPGGCRPTEGEVPMIEVRLTPVAAPSRS